MLREDVKMYLALYMGHAVEWRTEGEEKHEGIFEDINDDFLTFSDKENNKYSIHVDELYDLRYVGNVTDYHTYDNSATIDNVFSFQVGDDVLYDKLRYKEFNCRVRTHLKINENTHKIHAYDVSLIEAEHYINEEILCKTEFLYKRHGRWERGLLYKREDGECFLQSEDHELKKNEIEDITRAPKTNDMVTIRLKDSNQESSKGIVGAVTDKGFYLICDEKYNISYQWVKYEELNNIRYHGVVTETQTQGESLKNNKIDGQFGFKIAYLDEADSDEMNKKLPPKNSKVSYVAGVTERGLIAKEIKVEAKVEREWKYGIIVSYNTKQEMPYGKTTAYYIKDTYQLTMKNYANVRVLHENLEGTMQFGEKWINIVKYVSPENSENEMEIQETESAVIVLSKKVNGDVIKVRATEDGEVEQIRIIDRLEEYWDRFKSLEVAIYRKSQQSLLVGKLKEHIKETRKLRIVDIKTEEEKEEISIDDIEKLCVYGKVVNASTSRGYKKEWGKVKDSSGRQYEAQEVLNLPGERVMFELGVKRLETGVSEPSLLAYNVKALPSTERLYIIAYVSSDDKYIVVNEKDYREGNYANCRVISSMSNLNLEDLYRKDYLVEVELDGKGEKAQIRNITILTEYEKDEIKIGKVDSYTLNNNKNAKNNYYGFVYPYPWKETNAKAKKSGLYFNEFSFDAEKIDFNTTENDYEVLYIINPSKKVWILEVIETIPKNEVADKESVLKKNSIEALGFVEGETIYYKENDIVHIGTYSETKGGKIYAYFEGDDVEEIPTGCHIYRFGILTYDKTSECYFLNNGGNRTVNINKELVDNKVINLLNGSPMMLVQYVVNEENIIADFVQKVDKSVLEKLEWKESKVVSYEEQKAKCIYTLAEDGVGEDIHYLTLASNQIVYNKRNELVDEKVFVKRLVIPTWNESEPLKAVVAEVHLKTEERMILLDDFGNYVAKKHDTDIVALNDKKREQLEKVKDKKQNIYYRPSKEEPNVLKAYLEEHEPDELLESKKRLDEIVLAITDTEKKADPNTLYEEYCYHLYNMSEEMPNKVECLCRLFAMDCYLQSRKSDYLEVLKAEAETEYRTVLKQMLNEVAATNIQRTLRHIINVSEETYNIFVSTLSEELQNTLQAEVTKSLWLFECDSKKYSDVSLVDVLEIVRKLYFDCRKEMVDNDVVEVLRNSQAACDGILRDDYSDFWYLLGRFENSRIGTFLSFDDRKSATNSESELTELEKEIEKWREEVEAHSSVITSKYILKPLKSGMQSVLEMILDQIGAKKRELILRKEEPQLCFDVFEGHEHLFYEADKYYQKHILVFIKNGGKDKTNLKTATIEKYVIKIDDEIIHKKEGLKLEVKESEGLAIDNRVVLEVELPKDIYKTGKQDMKLEVEVTYTYADNETSATKFESLFCEGTKEKYIELKTVKRPWSEAEAKINPYQAGGTMPEDTKMFFGRGREINDCFTSLVDIAKEEDGLHYATKTGVFAYLYGQKRCGKSSILSQIFSEKYKKLVVRKGQEKQYLDDSLVFVYPDPGKILQVTSADDASYLKLFSCYLCNNIANQLIAEMKKEAGEENLQTKLNELPVFDVDKVANSISFNNNKSNRRSLFGISSVEDTKVRKEIYKEGDEYVYLEKVKELFDETDMNKRAIIVVIDEFTDLCIKVISQMPLNQQEAIKCLSFIQRFNAMGISVVLAGHERMAELLVKMGEEANDSFINQTMGRAASKILVAELEDGDAEKLITIPMKKEFEHAPFDTISGKKVIRKLKELSGKNPFFLTSLLHDLCNFYSSGQCGYYISEKDLETVKEQYIEKTKGEGEFPVVYDALLFEKGDSDVMKEELRAVLTLIAKYSNAAGECLFRDIDNKFTSQQNMTLEDMLKKLVSRRVIMKKNANTYKIVVQIFAEVLKRKEC